MNKIVLTAMLVMAMVLAVSCDNPLVKGIVSGKNIEDVNREEIQHGRQGEPGMSASIVTIGGNGNWHIDGVDTGVKAGSHDYHVVVFNANGGKPAPKSYMVAKEGETVAKPQNMARDGYEFDGWYKDSKYAQPYDFKTPVTDTVQLYAKWVWEEVRYTVSFANAIVEDQSIVQGDKATQPEDPVWNENVFLGWYADELFSNEYDFNSPVVNDLTIYAKWDITVYTVKFMDTGDSVIENQLLEYGQTVAKPDDPVWEDYEFQGWYGDAELTMPYVFSSPVYAHAFVYGKWKYVGNRVVSIYDEDGNEIDRFEIKDGESIGQLDDPDMEGYEFEGWYGNEDLTTLFDFNEPVTDDTRIYTKWIPVYYTVSFINTGDSIVENQRIRHKGIVVGPEEPVKENYKFDGWYSDIDLSVPYIFTDLIISDIDIYAKWILLIITNIDDFDTVVLNSKNIGTLEDPINLVLKIQLTYDNYINILEKIGSFYKFVNLDLSECSRSFYLDRYGLNSQGKLLFNIYPDYPYFSSFVKTASSYVVSLILPDEAETIEKNGINYNSAFYLFSNLQIIKGKNIKQLPHSAFYSMKNLKIIDFPELLHGGGYSFYHCTSLFDINIPKLVGLAAYDFVNNISLKHIYLPNLQGVGQGVEFYNFESITIGENCNFYNTGGFISDYNNNGKRAGIYTYNGTDWIWAPMP